MERYWEPHRYLEKEEKPENGQERGRNLLTNGPATEKKPLFGKITEYDRDERVSGSHLQRGC